MNSVQFISLYILKSYLDEMLFILYDLNCYIDKYLNSLNLLCLIIYNLSIFRGLNNQVNSVQFKVIFIDNTYLNSNVDRI